MHEQAPLAAHHVVAEDTTTGLNHRKMLMWLFLGSDCLFFAALISTYLIYRGQSLVGPFPEDVFSIPVTSVSTFALLMSSMSMVLAYSAINRGDMKAFRIWLLSTCMLGATFLGFQVFEFYDFSEHGLTPRTNLFGTTFFVLTGFHGGSRHRWGDLATLHLRLLPDWREEGGTHTHRPGGVECGPGSPVLALRGHSLDRHIRRGLSHRGRSHVGDRTPRKDRPGSDE